MILVMFLYIEVNLIVMLRLEFFVEGFDLNFISNLIDVFVFSMFNVMKIGIFVSFV